MTAPSVPTPALTRTAAAEAGDRHRAPRLRAALVAGCAAAVAIPALVVPASRYTGEADLARLLQFMAALKAGMVLLALGVLWWRLARPVPTRTFAAYAVGTWLMAGASVRIWQLQDLAMAAVLFHVGLAVALFAAWADGRGGAVQRPR